MQTGDSTSLMATNHVESSHRPYDTIPDNNNPSVPSPSLRAVHRNLAPTPVLVEGTSLRKPVVANPSEPRTNPFPSVLNSEDSDDLIDDIAPNFAGFQQHVLKLNPLLSTKNNYLVDRIARQQCLRYKHLLDLRAKHQQAIAANNCSCGTMCISLGGRANVLDSKDEQRGLKPLSTGCFPQDIPMPPTAFLPAKFECQLCLSAQQFKIPRDWTNHVYEDIQPFACTWEGCNEGKMFKRKADWVLHENAAHRHVRWWTCDVDDCRKKFPRRNNFLNHLNRGHSLADIPTWVKVKQCLQETTELPQDEPCRFCDRVFASWKELTDHLADHMTHISLPIMHKLVAKKELDEDTIIRHIQEPPPRTFPDYEPGGGQRQLGGHCLRCGTGRAAPDP